MKKLIFVLLLLSSSVNAELFKITIGLSTPIGNQDIHGSDGKEWHTGEYIGSLIITKSFDYVDLNLFHHSLILDGADVGVTGLGISKTFSF